MPGRRLALMVSLLLFGCSSSPSRARIVVNSDYAVPGEIDNLRVVVDAPGLTAREAIASLGEPDDPPLPRTVYVLPAEDYRGPYTARAEARLGETVVMAQTVDFTFAASGTLTVSIDLNRACEGVTCPSGQTCVAGRCEADAQDAGVPDSGTLDAGTVGGDSGPPLDAGAGGIAETDILGTWQRATGGADFGNLYLKRVGPDIRGVYETNGGRTVCDYSEALSELDCWWSEAPRRTGNVAGPATFVISQEGGGVLHAEGTWATESNPGSVNTDWDLDHVGSSIPGSVDPTFDNDAEFVDARP